MRRPPVPSDAGWYHAMNRVADGDGWLPDRSEARSFEARVAEVCAAFPIDLHAYCVLPRHYHLLVRAEPSELSATLARLESDTAFPGLGAPRTRPVSFGRHLMTVSRYIHLNPVDAGLVWRPEHWPYSSFRAYLGDATAPGWVVTSALLGRFGTIGARHRHRAYVYAGMDPATRDGDGRPLWGALFCPGSLAEDLAWRIDPVLDGGGQDDAEPDTAEIRPLAELAAEVAATFGVRVEALRTVRGGGFKASMARGAFVHAARATGHHALRDVAAYIGYAAPSSAAAAAERFRGVSPTSSTASPR